MAPSGKASQGHAKRTNERTAPPQELSAEDIEWRAEFRRVAAGGELKAWQQSNSARAVLWRAQYKTWLTGKVVDDSNVPIRRSIPDPQIPFIYYEPEALRTIIKQVGPLKPERNLVLLGADLEVAARKWDISRASNSFPADTVRVKKLGQIKFACSRLLTVLRGSGKELDGEWHPSRYLITTLARHVSPEGPQQIELDHIDAEKELRAVFAGIANLQGWTNKAIGHIERPPELEPRTTYEGALANNYLIGILLPKVYGEHFRRFTNHKLAFQFVRLALEPLGIKAPNGLALTDGALHQIYLRGRGKTPVITTT